MTGIGKTPAPATIFADALLAELVDLGVSDIVISPGSRSQALALAAVELERAGKTVLHVRIDERTAGFLALGLAIEAERPVVVVVTSGTAVANLHPAVLEAHHAGIPLILCTADRPVELRGIRSNQTTVQAGIFGAAVRYECDVPAPVGFSAGQADGAAKLARSAYAAAKLARSAYAAAKLARSAYAAATGYDHNGNWLPDPGPGPVHLNLQFREPLSGSVTDSGSVVPQGEQLPNSKRDTNRGSRQVVENINLEADQVTLVVAGAGAGEDAEAVACAGGWPLVAEVTSGARFGPNLVVAYRELLPDPEFGGRLNRVIVFGVPTLSREVLALSKLPDVDVVVVADSGIEWFDPGNNARLTRSVTVVGEPVARPDVGRWVHASRAILSAGAIEPKLYESGVDQTGHVSDFAAQRRFLNSQLDRLRAPIDRRMLAEAVWAASWPHDRLIFGASRLIREADQFVTGRRIKAHANRGLAGIDGTIATAIGIASVSQRKLNSAGTTRVLLGDLALLHDAGSLMFGAGEPRQRIQLIVGNDGGGSIFDTLPVAQTAPADAFERVQYTPQTVDLAHLAAAYGWDYSLAKTRGELEQTLNKSVAGPTVIEVPLAR